VTAVYDDIESRSVFQTVQLFICSKTVMLRIRTFKYSLHKLSETTLNLSDDVQFLCLHHAQLACGGIMFNLTWSHRAKIGHKNPFLLDVLRTIQRIYTKPGIHILCKCLLCDNFGVRVT